jgi:hypothetical protein
VATAACFTAPTPSPELLALKRAPKVAVSGVVVDSETGNPVEGIEVIGLPRGIDYPWDPPAVTDSTGRFTLALSAPAEYSFLLRVGGISILTPSPDDPGYVDVSTIPGRPIDGLKLKFIRKAFAAAPP